MDVRPANLALPLQAALSFAALAAVAFWPPASGKMMLISLVAHDTGAITRIALASGARLVGPGPLPGTMVVSGDRARIAARIRHWDVVLAAAPPAGCDPQEAGRPPA